MSIGPLCRIDRRFLPLLYNRRHLGVLTFAFGAAHGVFALVQFHASGNANPMVSVLTTSTGWLTIDRFPFQIAGLGALAILSVMAATSHDFWLRTLTAPIWKAMHMSVYAAYALLVVHISFGALQSEVTAASGLLLMVGSAWLAASAHDLGAAGVVALTRRRPPSGRMSARFRRYPTRAPESSAPVESALRSSNTTASSQPSPTCVNTRTARSVKGKIIGGCVVCPWHGYEYRPDTGAAPPPFTEAVPTFRVRIVNDRVQARSAAIAARGLCGADGDLMTNDQRRFLCRLRIADATKSALSGHDRDRGGAS